MEKYPPTLDMNILKEKMNLSDEVVTASRFSIEDLQTIYNDYLARQEELGNLKNEFVSRYIVPAKDLSLHSYNGRVKDPYHLIEKIIRKRSTNDKKYNNMLVSDYYKYITDLIGCRILLVYKKDWEKVHNYLTELFPNDASLYIDSNNYALSYDTAQPSFSQPYMVEAPVVHMRLGDPDIYQKKIKILHDHYYRSLHYVLRYGEYYVEIQVRTLFDEAWGEVDHNVLYPYHKHDSLLVGFSQLLNRLAGMGDEMSAYFNEVLLPSHPKKNGPPLDVPIQSTRNLSVSPSHNGISSSAVMSSPALPNGSTAKEILDFTLFGNLRKSEEEV